MDVQATQELDASASELMKSLYAGYTDAIALFQADPTAENWRAMKRAYAMFKVAFVAEA